MAAGVYVKDVAVTDGFEMQLGTNHFGHFALTGQLLDLLVQGPLGAPQLSDVANYLGGADDLARLALDERLTGFTLGIE